ncbi:MAG: [FeFe] hydrogenase H-cluster radical SAM maturase HydE [Halanaerobium sp.]|nr:[FeFe] hydrogenase H-cluster radical SAM maturase HydE [Halanaerobium sp.]
MKKILEKLNSTNNLTKDELIGLLDHFQSNSEGTEDRETLYNYATQARLQAYGKKVYLRALLEFSSYCKNSCHYCGLRKANRKAGRYRLSPMEIIECSEASYNLGYRTIVLQSGEDLYFQDTILGSLIREIKRRCPGMAVTLSIGERSRHSYEYLYKSGADRFLLRHETVNPHLYRRLHPGMDQGARLQCLQDLKDIGYQVGAGFIVGLPGQNNRTLADELLYIKALEPDMVGIGPFIPHPETPLGSMEPGSSQLTLAVLALARLLLPETLLPITTALNTLDPLSWEKGLQAGANVLMPNITPPVMRDKYELYEGKKNTDVSHLKDIKVRIEDAGFEVDMSCGDSLKWLRNKEV